MEKSQVTAIVIAILIFVIFIVFPLVVGLFFDKLLNKLSRDGMGVDNKPFSPDNTLLHMNPWDNINYMVPTVKTFYNEKVWGQPFAQSYDIDMKAYSNYL